EEDGARTVHRMRATRLGYVAVRHMLSPTTVSKMANALNAQPELTFLDLLIIAASTDDCEPILPVDFEELDALASSLESERSVLLQRPRRELALLLGIEGKRMLAALKMALVGRYWTRAGDVYQVAERCGCYPFEVERLRESFDRLLGAM